MVRLLHPWHVNIGKRLVKRPKVYLRDSGLLHALLSIVNERDLATNNKLGASWEGYALEEAVRAIGKRKEEVNFWATHSGAEVDLFWQEHGKNWALEVKYNSAPRLTASMKSAMHDLEIEHLWVVYPGDKKYPIASGICALPISHISYEWEY
jgi:hypothetical protein